MESFGGDNKRVIRPVESGNEAEGSVSRLSFEIYLFIQFEELVDCPEA
jgi:hypothetical protein